MKTLSNIFILGALSILTACSDVTPEISLLRSRITHPSTDVEGSGGLNFVATDQTSKVITSVSAGGYKMSSVVSKEDTTKEMVSAGGYTMIMNQNVD